jgi:N-methylhydantoinase A
LPRKTAPEHSIRVAVDTGGTFTDCVWIDVQTGRLRALKVLSTPADPSDALIEALRQTGIAADTLLHGTTVGTNALLQRKGGRVAFVTTKGFEDSIEIGRQARPKLYDFFFDPIAPLVPATFRFGTDERIDKDGKVLRQPSSPELRTLVERIKAADPDAIAISLLFSFANASNERVVAEALEPLGKPLSISSVIMPEFREYERASTTTVNAFLQPMMQRYLQNLKTRLRTRLFVMQSSGGLASLDLASRQPVRTILSGPAGGVIGAATLARQSGFHRIIGFDMGGTSTDVCLVDGTPVSTNEADVAGLPVRVPMLNIHTVGAGGGSLARFDLGGALRVGPESAGAEPGPICYGTGTQPTVTDANLLLGRIPESGFLGGTFKLDRARARAVTKEFLNQAGSDLSVEEFAEGIVQVVNATMEKAIRLVSIEKGYDPREFSLVAFGGAGGLHACALAAALDVPRVIVPIMPGALSAVGILLSDIVKDYSRTLLLRVPGGNLSADTLSPELQKLRAQATRDFRTEGWRGEPRFAPSVDVRYQGQGFEINVRLGPSAAKDFHAEHKRRYGYCEPQREIEIVTIRLRAWLPAPAVQLSDEAEANPRNRPTTTTIVFGGRSIKTKVLPRESLGRRTIAGPAIITEYSATTLVPPGWVCRPDKIGNLILHRRK